MMPLRETQAARACCPLWIRGCRRNPKLVSGNLVLIKQETGQIWSFLASKRVLACCPEGSAIDQRVLPCFAHLEPIIQDALNS